MLNAPAREFACGDRTCIAVLKGDYQALVRELKAACIAFRGLGDQRSFLARLFRPDPPANEDCRE